MPSGPCTAHSLGGFHSQFTGLQSLIPPSRPLHNTEGVFPKPKSTNLTTTTYCILPSREARPSPHNWDLVLTHRATQTFLKSKPEKAPLLLKVSQWLAMALRIKTLLCSSCHCLTAALPAPDHTWFPRAHTHYLCLGPLHLFYLPSESFLLLPLQHPFPMPASSPGRVRASPDPTASLSPSEH